MTQLVRAGWLLGALFAVSSACAPIDPSNPEDPAAPEATTAAGEQTRETAPANAEATGAATQAVTNPYCLSQYNLCMSRAGGSAFAECICWNHYQACLGRPQRYCYPDP
jgi:hypothetical protein